MGDSGLDDQKIFSQVALVDSQFIFRVSHDNRLVDVFNERLQRWEPQEHLADLAATVPWSLQLLVAFQHAHTKRHVTVSLGWLRLRIPSSQQVVWALVAYDPDLQRQLILLTNIPITNAQDAETVYTQWRYRPQIEHTYRFDQEQGLDVEDLRLHTMERIRRVFVVVLLATLFVYHIDQTWAPPAVLWLRRLGGKLGLAADADGPYLLLAGISAVLVAVATLIFARYHPFPRAKEIYG